MWCIVKLCRRGVWDSNEGSTSGNEEVPHFDCIKQLTPLDADQERTLKSRYTRLLRDEGSHPLFLLHHVCEALAHKVGVQR